MAEIGCMYKMLSVLLEYPEARLLDSMQDLREAVHGFPDPAAKPVCLDFLTYLDSTPLVRLQEVYTSHFDINPTTCLYVTYHKWGDAKERGTDLVELLQLYARAGFDLNTRELPDYLPVILEFLSVCEAQERNWIVSRYGQEMLKLAARHEEDGTPYAGLLEVVSTLSRKSYETGE